MAQSHREEQLQKELFQENTEKLLCVAGTPQFDRYMEKGKRGKCFAVLSDRAIYCKGKCSFSKDRRSYQTKQTDFRIDLEEFRGLKYLQKKNQLLLILGFIFLLLGPLVLLLDNLTGFGVKSVLSPTLDAVLLVLLACVFFMLFIIHKNTLLELAHTNGSIGLDLHVIPEKEEKLLIRYLQAYLNAHS